MLLLKREVIDRLNKRFHQCIDEKNCTLIRYDILEGFRKIYDAVKEEKIKDAVLSLIGIEKDPYYAKK